MFGKATDCPDRLRYAAFKPRQKPFHPNPMFGWKEK